MLDIQSIEDATQLAIDAGVRQFQAFLVGKDDAEHAARLLELLDPPEGARIVDAGCGIGETARLMCELRPDLHFVLVNLSEAQLALCPGGMERVKADFCCMPLESASADIVFYSYAASQCEDWGRMLGEARRVLKPDGQVFLCDLVNEGGANVDAWASAGATIRSLDEMAGLARGAGFEVDEAFILASEVDQLRLLCSEDEHARMAAGVASCVLRLSPIADPIAQVFSRHDRIGFQFSGGRDSTASLYLLRDWWPRLTVYHVDAGDQFPETREVVSRVRSDIEVAGGRFELICTDVEESRQEFGTPSDLVPVDNTPLGQMVAGKALTIVGRYECCWRNIMWPMHQRMRADGITLVIRGQRDSDYAKPPARSGQVGDHYEVLYPIQDWTGEQVEEYLRSRYLPIADFYPEGVLRASDCMTCTAWWDDGRAQYLRRFHPKEHGIFIARARQVREAIDRQRAWLDHELEA